MRQLGKRSLGVLAAALLVAGIAATTAAVAAPDKPETPAAENQAPLLTAIDSGDDIHVLGLGSSVGAGATLAHPETDAPSARLAQILRDLPSDNVVTVDNESVGGSVAYDGWEAFESNPPEAFPTVVLLAYGMNEGHPFAYNGGTTFPVNKADLAKLAKAYRDGGSTVMIATTPSPNTATTPWEISPGQSIYFPEGATTIVPAPADSVTTLDGIPFSVRHAEFNAFARDLAAHEGYMLVDVVPYWTEAVKGVGETALYSEGSYNHPNLTGHRWSYWPALKAAVAALSME